MVSVNRKVCRLPAALNAENSEGAETQSGEIEISSNRQHNNLSVYSVYSVVKRQRKQPWNNFRVFV